MKHAFVFPGQGSQAIGMLEAYSGYDDVAHAIHTASEVLGENYSLMIEQGPAELLSQTIHTQPVLLAMGVGVYNAFRKKYPSVALSALAGHSLGEYSALVAGEALTFEDALKMVRQRAQLMQDAVPAGTGAMAAILGLSDEKVDEICAPFAKEGNWVQAANYNAPGQVVIAGHVDAVNKAIEALKAGGAKRALILPVSVPSHTELMRPAAKGLEEALKNITLKAPSTPVWQNATLDSSNNPESIRQALIEQLYTAVRWTTLVKKIAANGIESITECGPGKILLGLNKRAADTLNHSSLHDTQALNNWNAADLNKEIAL
ncbi:MAG: ACP S-malonyltransferase [Pseudomonadota bacterium]